MERLLGASGDMGNVCFLDAVPVEPVRLEADIMTPHYAGWSELHPPGDWRSPTPIPFLVTAEETPFLFAVLPCRAVEPLDIVMRWLCDALEWAGGGATTNGPGIGRNACRARKCDAARTGSARRR